MTVKLFAPAEYWQMSESERRLRYNGCGPKGWGWAVPDYLLGVYIGEACQCHDYAYEIGVTHEDKESADRSFLYNMQRCIKAHGGWWWTQEIRYWLADFYYQRCVKRGGPWFWKGKNPDYNLGPLTGHK